MRELLACLSPEAVATLALQLLIAPSVIYVSVVIGMVALYRVTVRLDLATKRTRIALARHRRLTKTGCSLIESPGITQLYPRSETDGAKA